MLKNYLKKNKSIFYKILKRKKKRDIKMTFGTVKRTVKDINLFNR